MMQTVKITCVVENTVGFGTSCWGEHGLAFFIETPVGTVLFDTGQSGQVFSHNLKALKKDVREVDTVLISHGHYDHTGGLSWLLDQKPGLPVFADPGIFTDRYARHDGEDVFVGMPVSEPLLRQKCSLNLSEDWLEVFPGFSFSGRIPRVTPFEQGSDRLFVKEASGTTLKDALLDDRCAVLDVGEGLVVILGCCHSGLINTLSEITARFSKPITAVIGGTHLHGASEAQMTGTIKLLKEKYHPQALYINHCTGPDTVCRMQCELLDDIKVVNFSAGGVLTF
jgi:7,8-dihydropterin-6-yl-methyl-4-(beta-D-ribofuranosyl)aminobenzene 5'-phosphate synthase